MTPEMELTVQQLRKDLLELQTDVHGLRYEVYGNGKVGLKQVVAGILQSQSVWLRVIAFALAVNTLFVVAGMVMIVILLIQIF